jgi:uncharacterized FAD-dependent dehydrogenase
MPFILRNITLRPGEDELLLRSLAAQILKLSEDELLQFRIVRKGIDARRKSSIIFVYSVAFSVSAGLVSRLKNMAISNLEWISEEPQPEFTHREFKESVVIAGMGPAGLFCALRLAEYGIKVTLIERGRAVEERIKDVNRFWREGILDPESNVQFGEGGAGTFSDGKLTCRLRDPNTAWIIEMLVRFGAPPEIRYQAKPHIGSDRLRKVVSKIRSRLHEVGNITLFSTRLTGLSVKNGSISGAICNGIEELPCKHLVLAIGHSARDTYRLLLDQGLVMKPKPFAIGLRVEHPQGLVDKIQYGKSHPALPSADYALTWNNAVTGRSCYSFCMCPGGTVIGSSSEEGMLVINGMSNLQRDSGYANSALVVNVRPDDFEGNDPVAGIRFQQKWERLAFEAGGRNYCAPAQNLLSFMKLGKGNPLSSYRPGIKEADLSTVLPDYVISTLREGVRSFENRMRGFITAEATVIGVETRTSAPLRIIRDENCQSPAVAGLYPSGEGAGYAGGIISAALDGVRVADRIACHGI